MENIKYLREAYLFQEVRAEIIPKESLELICNLLETQNLHSSAIRKISTKLENLNNEFKYTKDRNTIHQISLRVKSPKIIMVKLRLPDQGQSIDSARKNLTDITGVHVLF